MTIVKRFALLIIVLSIVLQPNSGFALEYRNQNPPSMARVEPIDEEQPAIGYNEYDRHYIDLAWDVDFPGDATGGFINFYTRKIPKSYEAGGTRTLEEGNLPVSTAPDATYEHRMNELDSGTIYHIDMTAYHTYMVEGNTLNSPESGSSNIVKALTDIEVEAYAKGTNEIKIVWDDVWNTDGRIDYKLYISENDTFANTPPIFIGEEQIGEGRSVSVDEATGKLEYVHNVRDPGRVYYIRIEPDIADDEIKRTQYTETITVSSFILVKTTKMSSTPDGTVWKLDWSPVVTGLGDGDIEIVYHVYRGNADTNELPQYMSEVNGTEFFVTVPYDDDQYYFIIRAIVTRNGEEVYRGIRIESDEVMLTEGEVSSRPSSPEIVDLFERVEGDTIISYEDELEPRSATVLWRAPFRSDGEVDTDVLYDIWLIEDPNTIDNPPSDTQIASSANMGSGNHVVSGNNLVGYKYPITNLNPNSTYYLKMVAKKQFVEYVDDTLQLVTYNSDPSYKVIITPEEGPTEQPQVPARPPLKVKEDEDGEYLITHDSATIQLKNLWYEKYDEESETWKYIRTKKYDENDEPPFDPIADEDQVDDLNYRKISYDSGITIDVGCIEFTEGMSYDDLNAIPADKVTDFPVEPNDDMENPDLNPHKMNHNIDITLTDLEPNKTYVIWVRATRNSEGLSSGPSDPLIITTDPVIVPPIEQPVVPRFNYSLASDEYIDLGWDFVPTYNYYIKYGLEDDINTAGQEIVITPEDLYDSIYYRVEDLVPDNLYYFWIQAESVNESGETKKSEWSDSYSVRTLEYIPPDTPVGFGIKNSRDAITLDSITYEWMRKEGLEYIIEVSRDHDYRESEEYNAGEVSEFTVDGLHSNHRYYARLYAYDAEKDLRSKPTQSVTVRTESSSDEYDADQEIDDVITGEYVEIDEEIIDGVWNVKITGVNADRLLESVIKDKSLDYIIDLTNPPDEYEKIRMLVSDRVFMGFTRLGKNLIVKTKDNSLTIRPGVITSENSNPLIEGNSRVDYEIVVSNPEDFETDTKNMNFKKEVLSIEVGVRDGGITLPFDELLKPLKVSVEYSESGWYVDGKTFAYVYDKNTSDWQRLNTFASYDRDRNKGEVIMESTKLGDMAIAELGKEFFDDVYYHRFENAINNVASAYELKSIDGRLFEPDVYANLGDTVKFMFDILEYQYSDRVMIDAAKVGLITNAEVSNSNRNCTVDKVYEMITRVYELKTDQFLGERERQEFIRQNGLDLVRDDGTVADGSDEITRGEVMWLLEKLLVYTGELY
ncbi:fibronectin type III domain-containing protein [Herbivorax sp. ANBcel31]|uniref:fibronectin type III domain-containing protein n=1 Tax=Herbivorax sp. ANBcel31 TaxID=3069754 RepID=UPI0027AE2A9C|nr:fibronectin type III domain-containing protein [Herbivorax sp. ANBcel31]MDQ2087864.1 fibronectin type III domain-containing protein [Herbivorax sp. ANBcel31]